MANTTITGNFEEIGRLLARGCVSALSRLLLIGVVVIAVAGVAINAGGRLLHLGPIDDTDSGWADHSGLRPLTDNLTGCEYLATSAGGITPRLGADGRQVCRSHPSN